MGSCVMWYDVSHLIRNAHNEVLSEVGAKELWLLLLLLLMNKNLEFGPKDSEDRRRELRSEVEPVHANRRPRDCPVFMELVGDIGKELEQWGALYLPKDK